MGFDQSQCPVSVSTDSINPANIITSDDSSATSCICDDGSVGKTRSNHSAGSIRHSSLNYHSSIDRSTSQEELCDNILISSSEDYSGVIKKHQIINPMIKTPDTVISGKSIHESAIKKPTGGIIMRKSSSFSAVKAEMLKLDNLDDHTLTHDETAKAHHQNHANPLQQRLVPHRISTGDLIHYPNYLDRNTNYHPRSSFSGMVANPKITANHHNYSHFRHKQMNLMASSKWDDAEKWLLNRSPPQCLHGRHYNPYYFDPRSIDTVTEPPLLRSNDHSVNAFSSSSSSSNSSSSSSDRRSAPPRSMNFSRHEAGSDASSSAIAVSVKLGGCKTLITSIPGSPGKLNKPNLGQIISFGKSDGGSRKNKLVKSMASSDAQMQCCMVVERTASITFSDRPPPLQSDDHGNQQRSAVHVDRSEKTVSNEARVSPAAAAAHDQYKRSNTHEFSSGLTWRSPAHLLQDHGRPEAPKKRVVVVRTAATTMMMMRDASTEVSPRCSNHFKAEPSAAPAPAPPPPPAHDQRRRDPKESKILHDSHGGGGALNSSSFSTAAASASKQGDIQRHLFGADGKQSNLRPAPPLDQSMDLMSRRSSIRVTNCAAADPNPASPAPHVHAQASVPPLLDSLIVSACWFDQDEAAPFKHSSKFARESARIDAWEKHQKAKAEAELKKLEMKLERLRSRATEKIMNRVAAARVRAAEMRAAVSARQAEQLAKSLERANTNHHHQNQYVNIRSRGSNYFSESLGVCFPAILP